MIKRQPKISPAVIKRLPRYRRYLGELKKKGVERISSGNLSELMGYTASQIRQDLNNFGGFGQQGYGYNVADLRKEIDKILGLGKRYHIVIAGVGNLGHAVTNYLYYYLDDFVVDAVFDVNEAVIGSKIQGLEIKDTAELGAYLKEHSADIGVITTSKGAAQGVADVLAAGGVKAIWNFAPTDLTIPEGIVLVNEHLSDSLHELVYYMNEK